jgi:hypothetical protein
MDRRKADINEFCPPGGQLTGGQGRELRADFVTGGVARGELADGRGKLVLFFGYCQRHRGSAPKT